MPTHTAPKQQQNSPTERELIEALYESLTECVPDPHCDFGPAYAMMGERRREALKAAEQLLGRS
jgi:hypothetical protein